MAALAVSSKAGLCAPRGLASRGALAPLRPLRARKVAVAAANSADREAAFEIGKMATLSAVASTWMLSGNAQAATELSQLAASDNRIGTIGLLFLPAIGWVAYNMFQPAINQLNRMNELKDESGGRKRRGVAGAVGLGAALSLFAAQQADAATELSQLAASDNRIGTIGLLFLPALAWVGYNMLTPATNQLNRMNELKEDAAGGSRKRR